MAPGYSLNEYNKKQPKVNANIDGMSIEKTRNHAATQKPMNGYRGGIFNYPPQANWNKKYTLDPLSNFGSSSSKTDTLATVMGVATGLVGLAGTTASIFAQRSNNKQAKEKSDNNTTGSQSSELGNLTQKASDCKKSERLDVSTQLGDAIISSKRELNESRNKKVTAETTKANHKTNYDKYTAQHETFKSQKEKLTNSYADLNDQIRNLKNGITDENKTEIESQIKQLEEQRDSIKKQLDTDYSDKNEKVITDLINQYKDSMDDCDKTIEEEDQKIQQLNQQIREAEAAKKQLDAKINKD